MSTPPDTGAARVRPPRTLREAWVALAGLSAVFLFEMLDNSILNVALPTIGRELHASAVALQWVTGAYAVMFGGLMLAFGAAADRFGRRRVMLAGLALLAAASLATAFVTTAEQLIAVRALTGVAAAMTTPGSMALAFRLFRDDRLRIRATTVITTAGLAGLAIAPAAGGFVLAVAPWQVLLLVNVPIAVLAIAGVRAGIAPDDPAGLHRDPWTSSARCWARRRSSWPSSPPRSSCTKAPPGGGRGRSPRSPPPERSCSSCASARPATRSSTSRSSRARSSPVAWPTRPPPGSPPPASATW
ncbi:unnamed protein product [[Actinomadura] parvosata subsp. kistnae]|uniref:MFS transporter n=1 Tax=[Actinomadura] parvosata TaxID=1955412 RepID=UPI000D2ABC8A|nr:unnamed protein product [Actinomadura parvosata subsp. kistnae]